MTETPQAERSCTVCNRPLQGSGATRHRTCLPPHAPQADLAFTEFDTRLAAYAVILDGRDRVLLVGGPIRRGGRQWSLPGGGVEFAEDPADALAREITEETGYTATVGALLGVRTERIAAERRHSHRHRAMKSVQLLYRATVSDLIGAPEPGAVAEWVKMSAVADLRRRASVDVALERASILAAAAA